MTKASTEIWRYFGHSEHGAQHRRAGLPNQDAWKAKQLEGVDSGLVVAVADGHGSPRACRSHEGARLAVIAACETFDEFVKQHRSAPIPLIKAETERLAARIVQQWRALVTLHCTSEPLTASEKSVLGEARDGAPAAPPNDVPSFLAYGTTVIAVAVTPAFMIYLQLGDGDILVVPEGGAQTFRPLPNDDGFIANETTSLCLEPTTAIGACRVQFQFVQGAPPALILLSTDGYSNSFSSAEGFERVATDLLKVLRGEGQQSVEDQLPDWLMSASSDGSGDDVTVAVLWRGSPDDRVGG